MKQASDPHQRLRLGDAPLVVAVDPSCQRLLRYVDYATGAGGSGKGGRGAVKIDAALFGERDGVQVRGGGGVSGAGLGGLGTSSVLWKSLHRPAIWCGSFAV